MPTILITRPSNFSATLTTELESCGYFVFSEPLLTIITHYNKRPDIKKIDAVMITSRSAIAALENRRDDIADLLNLQCFCVGEKTSQTAKAFGFKNIITSLTVFNSTLFNHGSNVLHICGDDVIASTRDEFEKVGHKIITWVVYKAKAADNFTPELVQNLKQRKIDVILLFSPRTAEIFASLTVKNGLKACCKDLYAIGISEAVIAALRDLPLQNTAVAKTPSEDAIIECLQHIYPNPRNQ